MAHSLEVRVPLVDTILLEKIGKLLIALKYIDNSKSILASSPSKALPIDFIGRPKTGFSTPMASWISKSPFLLEESLPIFVRDSKVSWARKWACHVGNQYF
jgi:asparagine synthase (glutamine-hydrolysing)